MAFHQKKESTRPLENTGFATDRIDANKRFVNKNGSPNVAMTGISPLQRFHGYHYMLSLPNWRFFLLIVFFYFVINFIFATLYIAIGIEHLAGVITGSFFDNFVEAYFFSAQTLTTVGYGRISPVGLPANILSSFEALIGIMTLAIITGLLYGRFTKPRAFIKFSNNAIIAPFQDGFGLMVRIAPSKLNSISELFATMTVSLNEEIDGIIKSNFYSVPLQLDKLMNLALSWTIVHPIDSDSPLFNMTKEDIDTKRVQVIVHLKGFDEGFSNTVVARTGYVWNEIKTNVRFKPMFKYLEEDKKTVLELHKLSETEEILATPNAVKNA